MTTIKAELIQEIEQASDEMLEQFLKIWRQTKQETLIDFLRNSPFAEAVQEEEISFERDQRVYVDRFVFRNIQNQLNGDRPRSSR